MNKQKFKGKTLFRKTCVDNIIKVYNDPNFDGGQDWYAEANRFARSLATSFGLTDMEKTYYTQDNIGKAKYTVSFHDGESTHKDGSKFYAIATFKNKQKRDGFIKQLKAEGYKLK